MSTNVIRACLAEFIGTFVMVFVGAGAVWATTQPGYSAGPIVPALAHGMSVVFAAYALGPISGAYLNPAVTIAVAMVGALRWGRAAVYIVTQVGAAICAAWVLNTVLGGAAATHFGAFKFAQATNASGAFVVELILTFVLCTMVLQAGVRGQAGNLAGLVIGLTLAGLILGGGPISGASLNPVRTLGPALVAGETQHIIVYLSGTMLGAALAAVVSKHVLGMTQNRQPV
jgi:MIP family channel proteins